MRNFPLASTMALSSICVAFAGIGLARSPPARHRLTRAKPLCIWRRENWKRDA